MKTKVIISLLTVLACSWNIYDAFAASNYNLPSLINTDIKTVYISVQSNDYLVANNINSRYRKFVKSRLQEKGIKSVFSQDLKYDAELKIRLYINQIKNSLAILGYKQNLPRYSVYLEVTLEQPATFVSDPSVRAMAIVWDSADLYKQGATSFRKLPFIIDSRHLSNDIINHLDRIIDALIAELKPDKLAIKVPQANNEKQ